MQFDHAPTTQRKCEQGGVSLGERVTGWAHHSTDWKNFDHNILGTAMKYFRHPWCFGAHEESAFKHLCGVEFEKHLKPRQTKLGLPRFVQVNLNQLLNFFWAS